MRIYIENGKEIDQLVPEEEAKQGDIVIYEVLRIIDRVPLFTDDHFSRYLNSCALMNVNSLISEADFLGQLSCLIERNELTGGNVKVELLTRSSGEQRLRMFIIPHQYPSESDYVNGVRVGLLEAVRQNPRVKVVQSLVRTRANQAIADNNWYEVLLIDESGEITEGSRSNVFFVRNGLFYTAPACKVLAGVTRKKIKECISALGFQCLEEAIATEDLPTIDAAFISGTSPKILPIASIAGQPLQVEDRRLRLLMKEFDVLISDYIEKRKKP
ncbi:aminotransferase class IV [Mangrovibacterium sp.]|uniref:aminotransferase class IV n=1 Tax=Mangrovibacterium sp. TaxID=1961364 RepID=UPI00356A8F68